MNNLILLLKGRKREAFLLMGQGLSNKEIASEMKITTRTVEKHIVDLLCYFHLDKINLLRYEAIKFVTTYEALHFKEPKQYLDHLHFIEPS